jgi:trimethylamine--corrinoid protein Co-methyltransferase
MDQRGAAKARAMLDNYVEPKLDDAIAEELNEFVKRRENELPDSVN